MVFGFTHLALPGGSSGLSEGFAALSCRGTGRRAPPPPRTAPSPPTPRGRPPDQTDGATPPGDGAAEGGHRRPPQTAPAKGTKTTGTPPQTPPPIPPTRTLAASRRTPAMTRDKTTPPTGGSHHRPRPVPGGGPVPPHRLPGPAGADPGADPPGTERRRVAVFRPGERRHRGFLLHGLPHRRDHFRGSCPSHRHRAQRRRRQLTGFLPILTNFFLYFFYFVLSMPHSCCILVPSPWSMPLRRGTGWGFSPSCAI